MQRRINEKNSVFLKDVYRQSLRFDDYNFNITTLFLIKVGKCYLAFIYLIILLSLWNSNFQIVCRSLLLFSTWEFSIYHH